MNRYIIAPSASRDLNEIIDYFSELNIEKGERFIATFEKIWANNNNAICFKLLLSNWKEHTPQKQVKVLTPFSFPIQKFHVQTIVWILCFSS